MKNKILVFFTTLIILIATVYYFNNKRKDHLDISLSEEIQKQAEENEQKHKANISSKNLPNLDTLASSDNTNSTNSNTENINNKVNNEFSEKIANALKLLNEGNTTSAIELFKAILQDDPKNQVALEELGLYYLEENKNVELAMDYLQKLFDLNPNSQIAVNELTYALEEMGGPEKAEAYLKDLLRKHSQSYAISSSLSHLLARQGRIEDAIPYLENAAKNSIQNSKYDYEDLAYAYKETGKIDKSIEAYQTALDLKIKEKESNTLQNLSTDEIEDDIIRTKIELLQLLTSDNNCDRAIVLLDEIKNSKRNFHEKEYFQPYEEKCR